MYALARHTVDWLVQRLAAAGVAGVAAYHAALPAARRAEVLEQWRGGQLRVRRAAVPPWLPAILVHPLPH